MDKYVLSFPDHVPVEVMSDIAVAFKEFLADEDRNLFIVDMGGKVGRL